MAAGTRIFHPVAGNMTDWEGNASLVPQVRLVGESRMTGLLHHD